jgi:hypothetical protein
LIGYSTASLFLKQPITSHTAQAPHGGVHPPLLTVRNLLSARRVQHTGRPHTGRCCPLLKVPTSSRTTQSVQSWAGTAGPRLFSCIHTTKHMIRGPKVIRRFVQAHIHGFFAWLEPCWLVASQPWLPMPAPARRSDAGRPKPRPAVVPDHTVQPYIYKSQAPDEERL